MVFNASFADGNNNKMNFVVSVRGQTTHPIMSDDGVNHRRRE
jgi:hypothetical protein